jgi:hydroxymethylbilane synthase
MRNQLVIGTRKSPLALRQSEFVGATLRVAFPNLTVTLKHVITEGDRTQDSTAPIPSIGGKGLFTAELEQCLLSGEIDLAVHSLKDLPTVIDPRFVLGAILDRTNVDDVLISRTGKLLKDLPHGGVVGTSSVRRASQILRIRPDLSTKIIRGNVDTRLKKLRDDAQGYDAIVLAHAGLVRLDLEGEVTEFLNGDVMLPAPGQGALGVECRAGDVELLEMLTKLHDPRTAAEVTAERMFLHKLGAGCNTPVAARAEVVSHSSGSHLQFKGRCLSPDGSQCIEVEGRSSLEDAAALGEEMAAKALARGFSELSAA